MNQHNHKLQRHGLWSENRCDKQYYICNYHNGKEIGYEVINVSDGLKKIYHMI